MAKLSFATFNLRNLQLPGEVYYTTSRPYTRDEYDAKIRWTAHILKELKVDVIGFQELWSPQALEEAFDAAGMLRDYDIVARKAPAGKVQVGLAARKGMLKDTPEWLELPEELLLKKYRGSNDDEPEEEISVDIRKYSRPPLCATIKALSPKKAPQIKVVVAHLKSKRPTDLYREARKHPEIKPHTEALGSALSTIRRASEAAALRIHLNKMLKDTDQAVVVMGDLNDSTLSTTTTLLTEQPPYRLFEASTAGRKSDTGLYSAAMMQQYRSLRDVYFTHIFKNQMESLDHILFSEQFYDHSDKRRWSFHEMLVFNDHLFAPHGHDPEDVPNMLPSDHGVVKVVFDHKPAKKTE
ncbi:endonuclease/exonuclease/phosphatase family protein [Salidesulfovibrio onnuriiensis]|uniref:endonuclease/exonuclease/phosphatase family protein n=1 Tax=Salidesulfovibrio onnuriiensis TaxID=2583823 RepID=UPI00164FB83F|nr:endonuclease/exonuclease/phosphatase family protein [Salidesulfovibrio onnuriiensis]